MLCDVSKVHTGKGMMPKVTHTTEDEDWGQVGSSKKVFVAKSFGQKGGFGSMDHVVERVENDYWKIRVDDFQSWMFGFYQLEGEWKTTQLEENKIQIDYTYDLCAKSPLLYPINWLIAKLFWKGYMKQVLANIKEMAENDEPYLYD